MECSPINSTQSFTCSSEFDSIEDAYKTFKFMHRVL